MENNTPNSMNRRQFLKGAGAATVGIGLMTSGNPAGAAQQARDFEGQTAFITGGARGIGFATAQALAQHGANIVIYDIASDIEGVEYPLATPQDLARAETTIKALGVGCLTIQGDIRNGAALKNAMTQTVEAFGSLDMLVANAAVTQFGALEAFTEAEVAIILDINLGGTIKTIQAAMPIMREQNSGRIVIVSSIAGRGPGVAAPIYATTKWGVIGLAKTTAMLMGEHNVTCNVVSPSAVNTPLVDNEYALAALPIPGASIGMVGAALRQQNILPVGLLDPVEIANAIHFLCSNGARYISGDVIDVMAGNNARYGA